jgi:hypothetical protein
MKSSLILLALVFSSIAFGANSDSGRFNFDGSRGQRSLDLLTELTRTEYRYVQVPYQERVCRNETRYRQQCHTEPGRQVCRTSQSRQVCRTVPGRRVCRTRPDGRQICRNRPGRRVCHTEPGRRTCRTEPGRRVCRQVPYNERVCRYETRYRQERRAYTVVDTRTNARLTFNFSEAAFDFLGINVEVRADLHNDNLNVVFQDLSTPGMLIADNVTRNRSGARDNLLITESHNIDLVKSVELFAPIRGQLRVDDIYQNELVLTVDKITYEQELSYDLTIKKAGQIVFSRALIMSDFRLTHTTTESSVTLNLRQLGLKLPVDTLVDFEFGMHLNPSRFLNAGQYQGWSRKHSFQRTIK